MSKFPVFATLVLCFAALILYFGFVLLFYNGNLGAFLIGLFISIILLVWGLKLLKKHDDECKKNTKLHKKTAKASTNTTYIKESEVQKKVKKTDYYNSPGFYGIKTYQPIINCSEIPERFVMLDIETTGLNYYSDRIIEIAMIKYVNCQVDSTYSQLIDPETKIPGIATQISGITNEMIHNQPKIYEVVDDIYNFISGEIVAGYNIAEFDLRFLSATFARSNKYIDNIVVLDVLRLVKETIPKKNIENYKLSTVKDYFYIQNNSHRALADCETTFQVLKRCIKIKENWELQRKAEQLERLSKLNENEKDFIEALKRSLERINMSECLEYNVMGDRTINFTIKGMQIGRVKLNGKKYKMQVLDRDNVLWLEIDSVDEAINNIKHWIKYCKDLAS